MCDLLLNFFSSTSTFICIDHLEFCIKDGNFGSPMPSFWFSTSILITPHKNTNICTKLYFKCKHCYVKAWHDLVDSLPKAETFRRCVEFLNVIDVLGCLSYCWLYWRVIRLIALQKVTCEEIISSYMLLQSKG